MTLLQQAREFASQMHGNSDCDRHSEEVVSRLSASEDFSRMSPSDQDEISIVAYLHDVLLHTNASAVEIARVFGIDILEKVETLTPRIGESEKEHLRRICTDPTCRRVHAAVLKTMLSESFGKNSKEILHKLAVLEE